MSTKNLLAFPLLLVASLLTACRNVTDTTPLPPLNIVYLEGQIIDGVFQPMTGGSGQQGNEIAVVIHTPVGSVVKSTMKVEYNINSRTADAMINPYVSSDITPPFPTALDDSTATESFWFRIPDSEDLDYCDWIHYRWSFRYTRTGSSTPVVFIGRTRPIQLSNPLVPDGEGGVLTRTDACATIP